MEVKIVEVIKFDEAYFTYGDIVKVYTSYGRTYTGRIVYYSAGGVTPYIKLDISKRFESGDVVINTSDIVSMEYDVEHYNRNVESV